jgi:hypothetical protein
MDLSRVPRIIVGIVWGSIEVPLSMFLILIGGDTLYTPIISLCLIFIFFTFPFVFNARDEEISAIAAFGFSYSSLVILLWKTNTLWSPLSLPTQILICFSYLVGFLAVSLVRFLGIT